MCASATMRTPSSAASGSGIRARRRVSRAEPPVQVVAARTLFSRGNEGGERLVTRSVAGLVLERNSQAYAVFGDLSVLDRHVEPGGLGDPQIADRLRCRLDGVLRC